MKVRCDALTLDHLRALILISVILFMPELKCGYRVVVTRICIREKTQKKRENFYRHSAHSFTSINAISLSVSFPPSDERQDVQQKTFTKWINHHLNKAGHEPIKNLFEDLRDGHKLLALLETLTNQKYVSFADYAMCLMC